MWNDLHLPPCFITFNDDSTVSYGLNNQSDRFRKKKQTKTAKMSEILEQLLVGFVVMEYNHRRMSQFEW